MIVTFSESEDVINGPAKDTAPFMYPNDSSNDLSRTETGTVVQPSTGENESHLDDVALFFLLIPAACVLLIIIGKIIGHFAYSYQSSERAPAWWQFRLRSREKARQKAEIRKYVDQGNEALSRMIHEITYLDFSTVLGRNTEVQECLENFKAAQREKEYIGSRKKISKREAIRYANLMSDFERIMEDQLDAINDVKDAELKDPAEGSSHKSLGRILDKRRITNPLNTGFFGAKRTQKDDAR